ncbi:uncharacterized protein EHS24_008329 [Apiotrichum porosum]|uniref:Uncharacterized protein n=1 Tax=Apiotrichum porosum TaxID=105984 RepID=A0A427XPZ6_9TREE|nr:uncharacterized protein EHS24_008329 [Apiotrichum porosum]RSH80901.1 hypothetical protein EHS24_008329 [Apiotrichum porosum]
MGGDARAAMSLEQRVAAEQKDDLDLKKFKTKIYEVAKQPPGPNPFELYKQSVTGTPASSSAIDTGRAHRDPFGSSSVSSDAGASANGGAFNTDNSPPEPPTSSWGSYWDPKPQGAGRETLDDHIPNDLRAEMEAGRRTERK